MKGQRILIVEDDVEIRELISLYLHDQGMETLGVGDGIAAIQRMDDYKPDLILLDVMIPELDGFEVCKQIRKKSTVPIVFLTSRWESKDVVKGLDSGGDDYVTKPFKPDELIARVKSVLRRTSIQKEEGIMEFEELVINRHTFQVLYSGEEIPFLAKELKILIFLAERPNRVYSAEQLYDQIWGLAEGDARTVMVHISNIRKKLNEYAPGTVTIETLKGVGYKLIKYKKD